MVVLERSKWSAWLQETGNEGNLLRALPPGSLEDEQVDGLALSSDRRLCEA